MRIAEYTCPEHGVFEALADADADSMPCPVALPATRFGSHQCGLPSPWSPSPVLGRMQLVTAVRGKSDAPPTPMASNTLSTIGEGQRYGEWRAGRKQMWRDHDWKRRERG